MLISRVRAAAVVLPVVLLGGYLWMAAASHAATLPSTPPVAASDGTGALSNHHVAAPVPPSSVVPVAPDSSDTVVIRQRGKSFDPPVVVIHAGDSVVWVNESVGGWHDVQSYEGEFSSDRMAYGGTFLHTFDEPGVYGFYCSPHGIDGMQGAVVVLPEGEALPEAIPLPSPAVASTAAAAVGEPPALGPPDTISSVAGSAGSGGAAIEASLYLPEGVTLDNDGNLYIADTENCQVRRVDPGGGIVSVIGHESCGFSMGGDADLAPWQHTNHPRGVSVGPDGLLYVADTINCRVRRVERTGTATTIAGNGSCRASGDGGPATAAGLSPWGLAWDEEGNLYVADVFNCRIRKLDTQGAIASVAGNGACGFSGDGGPATEASLFFPRDVAAGPDGALFVADAENCRVRRIDPTTGNIETVAGTGACAYDGDDRPATSTGLHPWALAVDATGAVFVVDRDNCRVRRFVLGGSMETVAGGDECGYSGDASSAPGAAMDRPADLALAADGSVYIADTGNCRIRRVDGNGTIDTVAGSGVCAPGGDGGLAIRGGAWHPMGLAMGAEGDWYFTELDTCRVRRVDASGVVSTYAGNGHCGYGGDGGPATEALLSYTLGGVALADDGAMYIAEGFSCRVRRVDADGTIDTVAGTGECGFSGDGGPARAANLNFVSDVGLDGNGVLLISDPFNCRVRRVSLSTGTIDSIAGDGSCDYNGEAIPAVAAGIEPWGVAAGADGSVYVADSGNCRVRRVDPDGIVATIAGGDTCDYGGDGGPATRAQLIRPYDLALDRLGNLYVADLRTFTVRKVDGQGIISTVAGVGISRPIDIGGFDPVNGLLCTIHALPVPAPTYLGDGGPSDEAGLYFPYGIALDNDGDLYIADTFDHRVRRVECGAGVPCAGPAISVSSSAAPRDPSGAWAALAGLIAAIAGALVIRLGLWRFGRLRGRTNKAS